MEKKMNNKGFSLVELIIVVAIMAVLIGVLAPAYLQYVEKSKKTSDCSAIGSVMDAIEIVAADPAISWSSGSTGAISVSIQPTGSATATTYGSGTVSTEIAKIVPVSDVAITSGWGAIGFTATKQTNGTVQFNSLTITNKENTNAIDDIKAISPALANRFE